MINFDDITMEVIKRHQQDWRKIPDHSYRIFIIGGSRQKETNALFNLLRHQLDIYNNYLYPKYPYEAKQQLLINKREGAGLKSSPQNNLEAVKVKQKAQDVKGKH